MQPDDRTRPASRYGFVAACRTPAPAATAAPCRPRWHGRRRRSPARTPMGRLVLGQRAAALSAPGSPSAGLCRRRDGRRGGFGSQGLRLGRRFWDRGRRGGRRRLRRLRGCYRWSWPSLGRLSWNRRGRWRSRRCGGQLCGAWRSRRCGGQLRGRWGRSLVGSGRRSGGYGPPTCPLTSLPGLADHVFRSGNAPSD